MASWQSKALNKLLYRVLRSRLESCEDIFEMRSVISSIDRLSAFISVPSEMITTEFEADGVPCEWVEMPGGTDEVVVLFFHGGGFCFKSPLTHGAMLARICRLAGAKGLMVDYPLAPESPFPAAVDDCYAVYKWLLDQGHDSDSIVLAGDSAGGNLALTTMLKAREHGLPLPAAGVLLSPATDMGFAGESAFLKRDVDPFFTISSVLLMRNSYLQGAFPWDPYASPYYADLSDLPPMMIHTGTEEMLADDGVRLSKQLEEVGGEVSLTIWEGMPHVFPIFNQLPESHRAIEQIAGFIQDCTTDASELEQEVELEEEENELLSQGDS